MASYNPVVKNGASGAIFYISLAPRTSTGAWQNNPTLAAGDVKVSLDGAALNNLGTLPVVTPASSKMVKVTLSQAETNADNVTVVFSDAAGAEWCDLTVNLQTVVANFDSLSGRIPTALVSGRMDSSVGAMAAGTVTAAAIATDAIDNDAIAANAVTEIQSGLATAASITTLSGFVDTEVAAILAAVDTEVAAIKLKTDNLPTDPADASDIAARFTMLDTAVAGLATGAGAPGAEGATWIGDYPVGFATVTIMFTTNAADGSPVAPSIAFEAADIKFYKHGSDVERASTSGVTVMSPFDGITGLHCVVIDTSDEDDEEFWPQRTVYTAVLSPDETVDGVAVVKVIGQFSIAMGAAVTWDANPNDHTDPTTFGFKMADMAINTTPETIADAVWEEAITDHSGTAGSTAEALAAAGGSGDPWITPLPGAYAPGSAGAIIGSLPDAADNATELLDQANAIETGVTVRGALRLGTAALAGKVSGAGSGTETFRNVGDTVDRIVSSVDASGNRTAVATDTT